MTTQGGSGNPVTFSSTTQACTVSGATVTFVHAGDCTIQADQKGNADYNDATAVTHNLPVGKANQVVDFTLTSNNPVVGGTGTVKATTQGGSGNPVTFSPTTQACTVSGATVTFVHAGDCTIQADQKGNADYNDAKPVTHPIKVGKGEQKISFTPPSNPTVGGKDTLAATSSSGLPVSFSPGTSTNGACTVTGSTVTYNHALPCTVTATQAGNADYNPAPDNPQTFGIGKGTPHLDFTLPASGKVGGSDLLNAKSSDSDGKIDVLRRPPEPGLHPEPGAHHGPLPPGRRLHRHRHHGSHDDYTGATAAQTVNITGVLSVSAVVDANPTIGALFGYHHVVVTVDGLATDSTAAVTASAPIGVDVVAVGQHCGSLLRPARTCTVTIAPEDLDWYVASTEPRART